MNKSFSILIVECFTKANPWESLSNKQIARNVKKGLRPNLSSKIPQFWKELIVQCWDQDANKRPDFSKILSFFESFSLLSSGNDLLANTTNESLENMLKKNMETRVW